MRPATALAFSLLVVAVTVGGVTCFVLSSIDLDRLKPRLEAAMRAGRQNARAIDGFLGAGQPPRPTRVCPADLLPGGKDIMGAAAGGDPCPPPRSTAEENK